MSIDRYSIATSLLLLAAACSGGDGGNGFAPSLELRIIAGAGQTDTAGALLPAPLVIEVWKNGEPAPNVDITLGDYTCPQGCRVVLIDPATSQRVLQLNRSTDQSGRVSVNIAFNNFAGPASLWVEMTSFGGTEMVDYTIEPASASRVWLTPYDSALYIGGSYQLRAAMMDQWGNSRPDPVTLSLVTPGPVTLSPSGLVTGAQYGRAQFSASGAGFTSTAYVSVVPIGTIGISRNEVPSSITLINLNGSNSRHLVSTGLNNGGAPAWSPDKQTVAYQHAWGGGSMEVHTVPAAGVTGTPLLPPGLGFEESDAPQFSPDGWIYFHAWTHATLGGEIWRVRPDHTGAQRIGPAGSPGSADITPSPSPDGTRVAFISNRGHPATSTLRILTIGGSETDLDTEGLYPRWSPTGTWIAYWKAGNVSGEGTIRIIQPDGGNDHQVSANGVAFRAEGMAWSPNGEWILASGPGQMSVIQISSGLTIPLSFTNLYLYPGWRS